MYTEHTEVAQFPVALQASQMRSLNAKAKQSFREGLECLQAGDAATAVAVLSQSLEQAPEFAPTHIFLGIAHALMSNIYPAIDHLETATLLEQDNFAANYALAQLNFKLRIPKKGYAAAEQARKCTRTLEQRRMLTKLLKEERDREQNGIARPSFDKPFSKPALVIGWGGFAAALIAVLVHLW